MVLRKSITIMTVTILLIFKVSILQAENKNFPFLSLLLGNRAIVKSQVKEEVQVVSQENIDQITGVTPGAGDNVLVEVTGDLVDSLEDGSILYITGGSDERFPFGLTGRVASLRKGPVNADTNEDTLSCELEPITFTDLFQSYQSNYENIELDQANLVDVILLDSVTVSDAGKKKMGKLGGTSFKSFRDGAVIVTDNLSSIDGRNAKVVNGATVSLNMEIALGEIEGIPTTTFPIGGASSGKFVISGKMDDIKITNNTDFDLPAGLESLDVRLDSDLEFDAKFIGEASIEFGYFSRAWEEVENLKLNILGNKAEIHGLPVEDKIGKFPLAGLVWSVPCASTCPVTTGTTQTALQSAKAFGVIVWIYLNLKGELGVDGEISLAKLEPSELSLGLKKDENSDLDFFRSLDKKSSSGRLLTAPSINGNVSLELSQGISTELDFFAGGIYLANAGVDLGAKESFEVNGNLSYGTDKIEDKWSWQGVGCFTYNVGAGLVLHAATAFGIKIDTKWDRFDVDSSFAYGFQLPTDDEMDESGWHGLWYSYADTYCETTGTGFGTATSAGQVWMDRNLGASRVATSSTDSAAYGDLYQWGRGTDGHEKRNSSTTSINSTSDNPGHGSFILESSYPNDWRTPQNNNLWQGETGINNPCPSGFRLPTAAELEIERMSWSGNNATGAFNSPTRLVLAGYRSRFDGVVYRAGSDGHYWSSTVGGAVSRALYFTSGYAHMYSANRAYGLSVRCLKD